MRARCSAAAHCLHHPPHPLHTSAPSPRPAAASPPPDATGGVACGCAIDDVARAVYLWDVGVARLVRVIDMPHHTRAVVQLAFVWGGPGTQDDTVCDEVICCVT